LQNWTINQWYEMAAQLTARRATLDINHEFQELQKANQQGKPLDEDALGKSYVSKLLPLHMLVPGGDAGNYSGILLMFNKHFTVLASDFKTQVLRRSRRPEAACTRSALEERAKRRSFRSL